MLSADYQQLLAQLPPGSKLRVVTIELPCAPGGSSAPEITQVTGAPSASSPRSEFEGASRLPVGERSGPTSVEQRLASLRAQHGSHAAFKPREWSPVVGLSEREIERAIRHGAVEAAAKGGGRDHAAKTVSVEAMEAYLATVKAVDARTMEAPFWWDSVRVHGKRRALSTR